MAITPALWRCRYAYDDFEINLGYKILSWKKPVAQEMVQWVKKFIT